MQPRHGIDANASAPENGTTKFWRSQPVQSMAQVRTIIMEVATLLFMTTQVRIILIPLLPLHLKETIP